MNRSKRFITALLSSYATIAVNTVYALASIPLALHYLNKEEFGLWVLVTQLAGYLMLLEFGMSGSVARSLADHKDNIQDGKYGSILRTGGRVFAIQGLVVATIGMLLAWAGPAFLNIPANLQKQFTYLMAAQSLLGGLRLSFGSFVSPLWSHQRLDISNFASSTGLIVSFFVQWIGFKLGWQLYSLTIATASGLPISVGIIWISCKRLGYYPPRQYRGCFEPKIFRELFQFGGGIFLMNLGSQLTSASQVIVISRILGMDAAATWSVSTKIYSMAQQFVLRMLDSSAGGLAEMLVRKELNQLQKRFTDLVSISAVIAMAACAGITLMNGSFIEYWTSGKVYWDPWNNLLLGCLLFVSTITKFHTGLVGISIYISYRGINVCYCIVFASAKTRTCRAIVFSVAMQYCDHGSIRRFTDCELLWNK